MEFFSNLGDWPLETRAAHERPVPIFSWCGSDDTRDIVMPTYDHTESVLEGMGRSVLAYCAFVSAACLLLSPYSFVKD